MKCGQLMKCNMKIPSFKNYKENETEMFVPGLFLFFKKALFEVKASG